MPPRDETAPERGLQAAFPKHPANATDGETPQERGLQAASP